MTVIKFPLTNYKIHKKSSPCKYSHMAMLLVCVNNFLTKFLISQVISCDFILFKEYKYYLENFEIKYLGNVSDEEKNNYFGEEYYQIPYAFNLSLKRRKYKGIIEIHTKFNNYDSLEKSYFSVELKIIPEIDLNIDFTNISENIIQKTSKEFLDKLWNNIFIFLKRQEKKSFNLDDKVIFDDTCISSLISYPDYNLQDVLEVINDNNFIPDDSIIDTYHILVNIYLKSRNKNDFIFIKADDILKFRRKKENINSNGYRGGYKDNSRRKVHDAISFLKAVNIISFEEFEQYSYAVTFINKEFLIYSFDSKLLEYNLNTHFAEKRIGEFLSYKKQLALQKNIEASIAQLIKLISDKTASLKPSQLRDKIENTFDNLKNDSIIENWEYKHFDEEKAKGKDWLNYYKRLKIKVEF